MCVYVSFRCHSDEDLSKLSVTSHSSIGLSPSSRQVNAFRQLNSASEQDSTANIESADVSIASVLECIRNSRRMLQSQMDEVFELRVCVTLPVFFIIWSLVCKV